MCRLKVEGSLACFVRHVLRIGEIEYRAYDDLTYTEFLFPDDAERDAACVLCTQALASQLGIKVTITKPKSGGS